MTGRCSRVCVRVADCRSHHGSVRARGLCPTPAAETKCLKPEKSHRPCVCSQCQSLSVLYQQQPAGRARWFGKKLPKSSAAAFPCTHSPFRWSCQPTRIPTASYAKTLRTSQLLCQLPTFDRPRRAAPQFLRNRQKKSEKLVIQYDAHCILLYLAPSTINENVLRFISHLDYPPISSCVHSRNVCIDYS